MEVEELPLEFESDSDEVGDDLDMDRIPEEVDMEDSDEELRVALATGLIKPGSKVNLVHKQIPAEKVNNIEALKQKLKVLKNNLDWTERLDLTIHMDEEEDEEGTKLMIKDDFAREDQFQKVALEGARIGVIKAKRAQLPLLRPKDYFAEMAKSDEHMGKVKANLLTQKDKIDQRDKARQLRQQKKFAKDVQKKAKLKKQEDRRYAKEEIKMIRKKGEQAVTQEGFNQGAKKEGFNKGVKKDQMKRGGRPGKRDMKNAKFGFGGKKDKRNSAESHFGGPQKRGPGAKGIRKPQKRLGKSRRNQQRTPTKE